MYLDHFGLTEPPFRITPVTVFFFSGANRGEILDALIYSISEVEGIVKVSGEVGSGKTMLCRMLLEKLPEHIETIYLANPSLSREEMLYAIADGLGLNIEGERVGIIMQNIQNKLEEKAREGKRVVVLVDEAHAMPPETLEELRLLYNLQVGNAKLLQIVLFGQPELNANLDQPSMRQLKDRIVHHFNMQPLSRNILESYLMFRMRAAGYHGPNIFSSNALKLIAGASNGLLRRVNILADKSLLAAFVANTHNIEAHHVQAAIRDSELDSSGRFPGIKSIIGIAAAAFVLIGITAWWFSGTPPFPLRQDATSIKLPPDKKGESPAVNTSSAQIQGAVPAGTAPTAAPAIPAQQTNNVSGQISTGASNNAAPVTGTTPIQTVNETTTAGSSSSPVPLSSNISKTILFDQRLEAGKQLLAQKKAVASIQLFYNEQVNPERTEGFLKRAEKLGALSEIYLLPAKFGSKNGLRVLYGAYPSVESAHDAIKNLPARYQEAFATSTYIF
jgi:MSHA biogenesis protein MshM